MHDMDDQARKAAMIEGARIALERAFAQMEYFRINWAGGVAENVEALTRHVRTLDPTTLITRHLALPELAEHDAGLLDVATPAPE